MSYRTKAITFDERLVKIVSGILLRKTVVINFSDIQKIDIKSDFIVKRLGIARAAVSILSASAQRNHLTGYFDRALLDEIADRTVKAKDALSTVRDSAMKIAAIKETKSFSLRFSGGCSLLMLIAGDIKGGAQSVNKAPPPWARQFSSPSTAARRITPTP